MEINLRIFLSFPWQYGDFIHYPYQFYSYTLCSFTLMYHHLLCQIQYNTIQYPYVPLTFSFIGTVEPRSNGSATNGIPPMMEAYSQSLQLVSLYFLFWQ